MKPMKSFMELFTDPREGPYLLACMSSCDVESRRRYLAFLIEQEDERAEPLRCYLEVTAAAQEPNADAAATSRFRAQFRTWRERLMHTDWWNVVAPAAEIYACGSADRNALRGVRFRFECPNSWETLEPTAEADRRFCSTCGEHVHWVDSLVRAETLARKGACIAVPAVLARAKADDLTRTMLGRPDWRSMWAAQIFGDPEN